MQKPQKRKVCRYYGRGKCVKQDCPFVHQTQTKKPCKFWTETGYCRKGKNCQFFHENRQQVKKDKKFVQKNGQDEEQKVQRKPVDNNKMKRQQQEQIMPTTNSSENLEQKDQQNLVDELLGLKINEQLYNQMTKNEEQGKQKLQFFKQYPKSFPDYSKTPEIKERIKNVDDMFFKNKPFLEFLKEIPTKQQQEYYQIIRRFQDSFELENENQPRIYLINIRPLLFDKQMNMHFLFEQNSVQLHINQLQYPQVKARFQILNQSIPNAYKHKFVDLLDKYHSKHTLFDALKFFQNSFQKNYETVKFKLQNQHFKKLQLKQKIEAEKEKIRQEEQKLEEHKKKMSYKQAHHKGQHKEHFSKHADREHMQQEDNDERQERINNRIQQKQQKIYSKPPPIKPIVVQNPHFIKVPSDNEKPRKQFRDYFELDFNNHEKPEHQNLNDQITVQSLIMQNCPYLVPQKLLLYIECNCSKVLMYLFDAESKKQLKLWIKLKCKKCNDCVRIVWERQVIHNKGTTIGKMSFVNGKLIDIGGVGWKVGCNCDEEILKNKLYLPGERLQLNCHTCFSNMNITYNGIKHFNPFVKEFQMQDNKQLPLKGGCNHDKYNFRWTRYACCGRPFSCDQCHDLGAVKNHGIHQGITMICGYCAFEQSISSECQNCKKQLVKGQDKAGHWQGGLGCRDQTLLSKKDAKKYAGVGKVQSNLQKKKKEK